MTLDLGGNLTVLDQENVSDPAAHLMGVPDGKLFAYAVAKASPLLDAPVNMEHNSDHWAPDTLQVAGFTTAAPKLTYRPMKGVNQAAGVDNLTDHNYDLDAGFPAAGRIWFANLRHEF